MRIFFKLIILVFLGGFWVLNAWGQEPAITYKAVNVYQAGKSIAPLVPKNTGGIISVTDNYTKSRFAGTGDWGLLNGPNLSAIFQGAYGISTNGNGVFYVSDFFNNQIRKIENGQVSTLAGDQASGLQDGDGTAARFAEPLQMTIDGSGNVYVVESYNNAIRKVSPSGKVTTVAGNGTAGGTDGKGTAATFNDPAGIAIDKHGNLYVGDAGGQLVRKITPDGQVTTIAGNGTKGAANGKGKAATFNRPTSVVVDDEDNVYVTDYFNSLIRKITPSGVVSTFAGNGTAGTLDGTGINAGFDHPLAMTMDAGGNIYVHDFVGGAIREIDKAAKVTTVTHYGDLDVHQMIFGADGSLYVCITAEIDKLFLAGYTINKRLPDGLIFDPSTGIISGTPTAASPATDYMVTALNISGSSSFKLNIEVKPTAVPQVVIAAPQIKYNTPNIYKINTIISPLKPANTGGAVPATVYGTTTIFAGTGQIGGADGNAGAAQFTIPHGITADADGNIYITEGVSRLRQIKPDGTVAAIAKDGMPGTPFNVPKYNTPKGVVKDAAGNLFIANYGNHNILKVTPDGTVSVFAGGTPGGGFKDGQGTAATITWPGSIAIDANDNLYVTDYTNRIRKISPTGYVFTFVGDGNAATLDGKYTASSFNKPVAVAVDDAGNLYVAEQAGNVIRKVTPLGDVTTLAGDGQFGIADGQGNAARFAGPAGLTIDKSGNLYVTQIQNGLIRRISPDGVVTTIAGGGSPGSNEGLGSNVYFNQPQGIVTGPDGNLYVADGGNYIKKVIATGYTIDKPLPNGLTFDPKTGVITGTPTVTWPATDYLVTAYNGGGSSKFILNIEVKPNVVTPVIVAPPNITYKTPNVYTKNTVIPALGPKNTGGAVPATIYGQVTTFAGQGKGGYFNHPTRLAQDASGNLFICDRDNGQVKKITPAGVITVVAGGFNQVNGVTVDSKGNVFIAEAATNQIKKIFPDGTVSVFAGSGAFGTQNGPAASASFYYPYSVIADKDDNLYVADDQNNLIRKITPEGDVSTLAGSGQATFADGKGTAASFYNPSNIAVDADGNVYVADPYNYRVRKINPDGTVTTVAGNGSSGTTDGPAASATFNVPAGVSIDRAGNIYVADISNNLIRKIDPEGIVTTLAGNGGSGAQDGIGAQATFTQPNDVQVNPEGFLYVTDYGNSLVRKVIVTGYTIDKVLPDGLVFDPTTGIITGTPTVIWPATDYLVTAYNTGGSSSFIVNIKVTEFVSGIQASAPTGNIDNCENAASAAYQQFTASGTFLSEDINVQAPAGFMVSASPTAGYGKVLLLILKGDKVDPVKVYVKLDAAAVAGSYAGSVVLSSAGVPDVEVPVSGEVHKVPVVSAVSNPKAYCNDEVVSPISFSGTADSYSWTNSNTAIGLASNGTGQITFTAKNTGNAPISSTITVTPNSSSGLCPGKPVTFTLTVNPTATPVVNVSQAAVNCVEQPVSFTVQATNTGSAPVYQWMVNGQNVLPNGPTYSSSTLNANDEVSCIVTTDLSCSVPGTSNTVKIAYKQNPVMPTVTINPAGGVVGCIGTQLTFKALPQNAGINPGYQWLVNGQGIGNTGDTYVSGLLGAGDKVTCIVVNNDGCTPVPSAQSLPATITAPPVQVSTVIINPSVNMPICPGMGISFTPTPANYQTSAGVPTYVWYVNGGQVSSNDTFNTNALVAGDKVYCIMTTYARCVAPQQTQSNTITIQYKPIPATPSITISPYGGIASCVGLQLTFTAEVTNAGINPAYQWMVNGQPVHNPGNTYITSTLAQDDRVTCVVINNDGCSPVSSPVSEAATIIADPIQVSTVTIAASVPIPVCAGKEITFTPTPANYQTISGMPSYVWYVNNGVVSTKDVYTTKTLVQGDEVYCVMTTYGKCVAPTPARSNTLVITLAPQSGCIIEPISIPNAFTPNADGVNDTWIISNLTNYKNCTVNIFNRYGITVFNSIGYTSPWNGNYNNKPVPAGSYYYIIDPKNGQSKLSGYVVVLR